MADEKILRMKLEEYRKLKKYALSKGNKFEAGLLDIRIKRIEETLALTASKRPEKFKGRPLTAPETAR